MLVLFIVLLAMAGILAWGVPAIQGLQDHAEFQSILTQMVQVNNDLLTLRDPQNTRLVTVSMNQGSLRVETGSRWVITAANHEKYTWLNYTNWQNDDVDIDVADVKGSATGPVPRVTVHKFVGSNPVPIDGPKDCPASCTLVNTNDRLSKNPLRVQFTEGSEVMAETWIFEVGRLTYRMRDGSDLNRVHVEMGAVFAQQGERVYLEQQPTLKEPVFEVDPKDTSYFVRLFQLNGTTAVSGKGRHTVLANLVDNFGTTRGRPHFDKTWAIHLQFDDGGAPGAKGLLEEGYCNHLGRIGTAPGNYTVVSGAGATVEARCAADDHNLVFRPNKTYWSNDGWFVYELNQASVRVIVRNF